VSEEWLRSGNWCGGLFYEADGTSWSSVELAVERRLALDERWQKFLRRRRAMNRRREGDYAKTGAVKYRCPF